jgi:exopolyphosphatase / guanosine-5'-triphosphate,3'-diphosphate pyrophosphatase
MTTDRDVTELACIDLGSNSFHLVVAREVPGQPAILDRLRDRVALAEGLNSDGSLDEDVAERALACLARFGQRAAGIAPDRIRAVGTATFRRIRDGGAFLERAGAVLGVPVEVLPGREEARLIYLGVAHTLGDDQGRRMVVDIGGGSTECVLGERFESDTEESLAMGCVSWSQRFFTKGMTRKAFERGELEAARQLEPVQALLRRRGWSQSIGASGTILAVAEVLQEQGWSEGVITRKGLDRLRDHLVDVRDVKSLELKGLRPDRCGVLAGGLAILRAVFTTFELDQMGTSPGSLREGLMYDLLGRIHHEDVRGRAIQAFGVRMGIDEAQAERVSAMARHLFDACRGLWGLRDADGEILEWAAWIQGVGLSVSYTGYPKHGAYLIEHADLPGFSLADRHDLSQLVRNQRRTIKKEFLNGVGKKKSLRRLLMLLRLAVTLHRGRGAFKIPRPAVQAGAEGVTLGFAPGWLAAHPLTEGDLAAESSALEPLQLSLVVV